MDLAQLASLVVNNPSLQAIHLNQLLLFFAVISSLRDDLLLIQPSEHAPTVLPAVLPSSAEVFIASACKIPRNMIQDCWDLFKDVLWHANSPNDIGDILQAPHRVFEDCGLSSGFSTSTAKLQSTVLLTVLVSCAHVISTRASLFNSYLSTDGKMPPYDASRAVAVRSVHARWRCNPGIFSSPYL